MLRTNLLRWISGAVVVLMVGAVDAAAQQVAAQPQPAANGAAMRGYAGQQVRIPGIFVTPMANAPFSATVHILSRQKLPDGSEHVVTTLNHIARSSSGIIYNERRRLVPVTFKGEPRLLSGHIYNPSNHLNTFFEPETHLAREAFLPNPPPETPGPTSPGPRLPGVIETDLGPQMLNGVELRGLRRERTIQADSSGTGQPVIITDEYWYSPQLFVYLIVRHNDPRTGEQMVAVSEIDAHEPDGRIFVVPEEYKVVDETPPVQQPSARKPLPKPGQ